MKLFYLLVIITAFSYLPAPAEPDWVPLKSSFGVVTNQIGTIKVNKEGTIFIGISKQSIFSSTDNCESWVQYLNYENTLYNPFDDIFFDSKENIYTSWGNGTGLLFIDKDKMPNVVFRRNYFKRSFFGINSKDELFFAEKNNISKALKSNGFAQEDVFNVPDSLDIEYMLVDHSDRVFVLTTNATYLMKDDSVQKLDRGFRLIDAAYVDKKGNFFAGMKSVGVIRSTDNLKTWDTLHLINPKDTTESFYFNRIIEDAIGNIYVCTTRGVFKSEDKGNNWSFFIDIPARTNVTDLAFLTNGDILASEYYNGLYVSHDNAKNWEHSLILKNVPNIKNISTRVQNQIICSAPENGKLNFYRSDDGGNQFKSYSRQLRSDINPPFYVNSLGDIYLIQSDNKIYINYFGSDMWNAIVQGLEYDVKTMFFLNDSTILAGTFNGGIYRSTDYGLSWTKSKMTDGFFTINVFLKYSVGKVYALTDSADLFESVDDGYRWTQTDCDTNLKFVKKIEYFNDVIYCINDSLILRQGNNFKGPFLKIIVGNEGVPVVDMLNVNDKYLFVAIDSGAVWYLDKVTNNWTYFYSGLEGTKVNSFASDTKGNVYAATSGKGIMKSSKPIVPVEDEKINLPDISVFPNPTEDEVIIKLSIEEYSNFVLCLYDIYGKKLIEEKTNLESYNLNLKNYPAGLYLLKVLNNSNYHFVKIIKK